MPEVRVRRPGRDDEIVVRDRTFGERDGLRRGLDARGLGAELHGQRAELTMAFPSHLHTRLNLISNVGLFRGVVRITGGKDVRARMTSFSATGAHYECSWS